MNILVDRRVKKKIREIIKQNGYQGDYYVRLRLIKPNLIKFLEKDFIFCDFKCKSPAEIGKACSLLFRKAYEQRDNQFDVSTDGFDFVSLKVQIKGQNGLSMFFLKFHNLEAEKKVLIIKAFYESLPDFWNIVYKVKLKLKTAA